MSFRVHCRYLCGFDCYPSVIKINLFRLIIATDFIKRYYYYYYLLRGRGEEPFLIKNWDIGPCVTLWTPEYVSSCVGKTPVKCHVSLFKKLDFIKKNFQYKTLAFDELIQRIYNSYNDSYFLDPEEVYYLRSLGNDPRGKDVANFLSQCKELAKDFNVPPFFNKDDFFSSVFRASSQGLQLWTHYDVMDNILIQVNL